jgi:hypothetical protein
MAMSAVPANYIRWSLMRHEIFIEMLCRECFSSTKYINSFCSFYAIHISSSLDMNTTPVDGASTGTIGALILVPVVIAIGATAIAIKTTDIWPRTKEFFCGVCSSLHCQRLRKKKRASDLSDEDSWCDIESLSERRVLTPELPSRDSPSRIWHPRRSSRLTWSFMTPKTSSQRLYESPKLSDVQLPAPILAPPVTRLQSQEEDPQDQLMPLVHHPRLRSSL